MVDLPKLVKPYYSLSESLERLKLAGAQLNDPSDLLLLGRNGLIDISLLCDELTHLVEVEFARPVKSSREILFKREQEEWSNYDCTEKEFEQFMRDIEAADWVIIAILPVSELIERKGNEIQFIQSEPVKNHLCNWLGIAPQDILDEVSVNDIDPNTNYASPIACWNGFLEPFLIKPLNMGLKWASDENTGLPKYKKSHWLSLSHDKRIFESLVVAEIDGTEYYICKDMEFNPLINRVGINSAPELDIQYQPSYALDHELVENLIKKENFVISNKDLQVFEQNHLGVEHGFSLEKQPEYLDKTSKHYSVELDIAIQAHIAVFKEKYGNPHQSGTDRITSWLMKNYPEKAQSDAFLKRIRTIVLPKK